MLAVSLSPANLRACFRVSAGAIAFLVIVAVFFSGLHAEPPKKGSKMSMQIASPAFAHAEMIPERYTCKGNDISPPLEWKGAPEGSRSFALIFDDPDAPMGTWVHWVVYDLPAECNKLPEDVPEVNPISGGGVQGTNSWGRIGYGGPCPPSGTHRYFLRLYALDTVLGLKAGATKAQLLKAMEGHILDECELMGRYAKH